MNKTILIGRLTKDLELSHTNNNKSYCKFTVAVTRPYKSPSGESQADFINCIAWGGTADNLVKYMRKGSQIAVEGSIQTGSYEDTNGVRRFTTNVFVEKIEYLSKTESAGSNQQTNNSYQASSETQKNQEHFKQQESNNPFDNVGDFDVTNDDLPF